LLSVIGAYGMINRSVVARTREIGIRMALGANRATVLRIVLASGLGPAIVGLGLGLLGSLALSRTIAFFLYETSPLDPLIYVMVTILLLGVTMAACLAPARRAAQVAPMAALRDE
jgi:ABC-type antimicrobial peptide transport system permease subunit